MFADRDCAQSLRRNSFLSSFVWPRKRHRSLCRLRCPFGIRDYFLNPFLRRSVHACHINTSVSICKVYVLPMFPRSLRRCLSASGSWHRNGQEIGTFLFGGKPAKISKQRRFLSLISYFSSIVVQISANCMYVLHQAEFSPEEKKIVPLKATMSGD